MTAERLYDQWVNFGEAPFVVPGPANGLDFDAFDYAKEEARERCGDVTPEPAGPPPIKERPIPETFPPGSKFWDLKGSDIALLPSEGYLVSRGGGRGKFVPLDVAIEGGNQSTPSRLAHAGIEIDEAEFRAIASSTT